VLADFIQTQKNVLIMATRLVPAIQCFLDASRQLPGLFEQLSRATSPAATGADLVGTAALHAIELFRSSLKSLRQLHDQGVFGTHLVHERGNLLGTRLFSGRMG